MKKKPKVILIGVDGASYNLIKVFNDSNKLSTFKYLMENGASGILKSLPPLVSPALWVEIGTGKKREKTNIKGFFSKKNERKEPFIWEILSHFNLKSGLVEYLISEDTNENIEFFIPGWMESKIYTKPNKYVVYKKWLENKISGKPLLKYLSLKSIFQFIKFKYSKQPEFKKLNRYKFRATFKTDIFLQLLNQTEVDFASIVFYGTDAIQHSHWKYFKPEYFKIKSTSKLKNSILDIYTEIDTQIKRIIKKAGDDTYIIIVSDHGQKETPLDIFQRNMINPKKIMKGIGKKDYGNAFAMGNTIHLQLEDKHLDEMEMIIENSHLKETGDKLFNVYRKKNDLSFSLKISCERNMPDLNKKFAVINNNVILLSDILKTVEISGIHSLEGTFIIKGPGIKRNLTVENINILDIAPIILHLFSLPLEKNLDGKLPMEIFTEEFQSSHKINYIDQYDFIFRPVKEETSDQQNLEKKLEDLGYL